MESFGIHPMSRVDAAYQWKFDNAPAARRAAEELCREHRVEVVIFRLIGTYKLAAQWFPESVEP